MYYTGIGLKESKVRAMSHAECPLTCPVCKKAPIHGPQRLRLHLIGRSGRHSFSAKKADALIQQAFEALPTTDGLDGQVASLTDALACFASKERAIVVKEVYGVDPSRLAEGFAAELSKRIGVEIPTEGAFTSVDYHLDWLVTSLTGARDGKLRGLRSNTDKLVRGNQEDVDLLIAFEIADETHVVMVEAKCVSAWSTKQLRSKVRRLKSIFGDDGKRWHGVKPHFALLSICEPPQEGVAWATWMKVSGQIRWLQMSDPGLLWRVERCDKDGKRAAKGGWWHVVPR